MLKIFELYVAVTQFNEGNGQILVDKQLYVTDDKNILKSLQDIRATTVNKIIK